MNRDSINNNTGAFLIGTITICLFLFGIYKIFKCIG